MEWEELSRVRERRKEKGGQEGLRKGGLNEKVWRGKEGDARD